MGNMEKTEESSREAELKEQLERFRAISELTSDMAYAFCIEPDGSLRAEWVEGALTQITGFTVAELRAKGGWMTLLHPDDLPVLLQRAKTILAGPPDTGQIRILTKDGETRWLRIYGRVLRDEQERPIRIVGAAQDVTDQVRVEDELRRERDLMNHVMATSPAGILVTDCEGQVTFANARAEQVLGLSSTEISQRSYNAPEWRITDYEGHPFPNKDLPFQRVMRTSKPVFDVRHAIEWPDGRRVLLSINAAPLFDEQDQVYGMVATVEDVTEQKRAGDLLQALNQAALAMEKALTPDQVFSVVAQEFKQLGLSCAVFFWDEDQETFYPKYLSYESSIVQSIEKLLGVKAEQFPLRIDNLDVFKAATAERATVFVEEAEEAARQLLPGPFKRFAGRIVRMLKVSKFIPVPLIVEGHVMGYLSVQSQDLKADDVPAMIAFANQLAAAWHRARLYEQGQQELAERIRAEEALRESLQTSADIVQAMPSGLFIYQYDPPDRLTLLDSNPEAERLTGIAARDWQGRPFDDIWPNARVTGVTAAFLNVMETGQTFETEDLYYEDERVEGAFRIRAFRMPANRLGVAFENIIARKRAEMDREQLLTQIQEQAHKMQRLVDTVPEGVLLLNSERQVVLVNPLGEKALNSLADAQVGDVLTHLGDCPLSELLTSPPKGLWHEVTVPGYIFQVIARSIENGSAPGGWVLVIRDVTQEREVMHRVQRQERLAAVGQLAAGIAHDFNNIMATIVLYAQMASRSAGLPVRDREWMETINQQAQHASQLIQQILDFSRQSDLERQPLDLVPFLKEQVKLLERTLPEHIKIRLEYGTDQYIIHADPTSVQQVTMNLAVNARDAMPQGGELCFGLDRIRVQDRKKAPLPEMEIGDWVQLTVSDTGVGIPSDILPHIFDPFFTTKSVGEGTGLGLAQVFGIVMAHDGHIDVKSQPGRGTSFAIYLPVLPDRSAGLVMDSVPSLTLGQKELILVVEDSAVTREALVESLELLNYGTLEASNGREALALLEQRGDDIKLVLSDVVMPELGGIALLHHIQEHGLALRMVLLTGHPIKKELENLRSQNGNSLLVDWMLKPPSLEQLAQVVARALARDCSNDGHTDG